MLEIIDFLCLKEIAVNFVALEIAVIQMERMELKYCNINYKCHSRDSQCKTQ